MDKVDKVVTCECGFEVRGSDEDALIRAATMHSKAAHGLSVSAEFVAALIRVVPAEFG